MNSWTRHTVMGLCQYGRFACILVGVWAFSLLGQAQTATDSKWYTAARLNGEFVMDPMMPLAQCDADTQNEFSQRSVEFAPSGDFWTLFPVSLPQSATQSQALSELRRTPMWVVDEKGSRLVKWAGLVGAQVRSNGPCFHLSSFILKEPQRFRLSEDTDVLVTPRPVSPGTRLIRARSPVHQAFANNDFNPKFERPLMQWMTEQPMLMRTIATELPSPSDGVDRALCVPAHQPFNASIDGKLSALVSVKVQWCECAQRVGNICSRPNESRGSQPQWLAVIDRRSGWVWFSTTTPPTGLQQLTVIALATGGDVREDVVWILEEYPRGVASSVLLRDGRTLKRQPISSYSGL